MSLLCQNPADFQRIAPRRLQIAYTKDAKETNNSVMQPWAHLRVVLSFHPGVRRVRARGLHQPTCRPRALTRRSGSSAHTGDNLEKHPHRRVHHILLARTRVPLIQCWPPLNPGDSVDNQWALLGDDYL